MEGVEAEAPGGPVTFTSHSVAHVLGLRMPTAIRMRLQRAGELVRFAALGPSGMIAAMEGVNAVVPLPPGSSADLAATVDEFLRSIGVFQGKTPVAAQPVQPRLPFASVSLGLPSQFGVGPSEARRCRAAGLFKCWGGCSQGHVSRWRRGREQPRAHPLLSSACHPQARPRQRTRSSPSAAL